MTLIRYITKIHFAEGVLDDALPAELGELSVNRPMIVTDYGVIAAGLLAQMQSVLPTDVEPVVFDRTVENPNEANLLDALAVYQGSGCDGVIGLGGGSSLDLAKMVALMASHDGPISSYAAVEGGIARIKNKLPPVIAIPTTAGTGSEVGRGALLVLDDGRKLGFLSSHLVPKAAICDPVLTLGLPPRLTAATGMDAVAHCIETYIATAYNPPADGIAIDGLTRAAANIEMAVEEGGKMDSRREMMAAAVNGALAFQKGLGGVHAISHALGGLPGHSLHHGTLNAILLPHILEFNAPAVGNRYGALRQAMGLRPSADLGQALTELSRRLGLPMCLSEIGVDEAAVAAAAPLAEKDHTNGTNPRKASAADYHRIMMQAL